MNCMVLFVFSVIQINQISSIFVTSFLDDLIDKELYFNLPFNTTRKDCKWRKAFVDDQFCEDDVKIYLINDGQQELVNTKDADWLRRSAVWNVTKENVFFVHGYAAGDNSSVLQFIRDAFIRSNGFNLFLVDYSPVSRAPCYVSLVHNTRYIGHCLARYLNTLHVGGLEPNAVTCIGHSMGAHICGQMKHTLKFAIKKIIGLDPALPLISDGIRLKRKAAQLVHVIQTNAGYYGDIGSIGDVNICVNNGNMQPFCQDSGDKNLCSHVWALCFMAQSLFKDYPMHAKRCTKVCPHAAIFQLTQLFDRPLTSLFAPPKRNVPHQILVGTNISDKAQGSYCLANRAPPFCPDYLDGFGDPKCCSLANMFAELH